ncbi:MAG: bifunctional phosphopantothenoylcysteine decarboxylase/phosphopantothenate--cysteine ligase CoaBC [Flavobacteriales bacterium]|nr:bifunctional phosphopantothenoylcysteine decarboxylase/phosphopantothenate--cysteine ligase CoaBC [Flavobacteriales bacterium]
MRLTRNVLLGVTGSIAAYKSAQLVRELVKAGASVQVVMTPAAHDFVTPLTLATLSKRPVLTQMIDRSGEGTWNDHVHLARWADLFLVAPASANTMSKMVQGQCDNLLMACFLSATCPVYVAPAMDLEMFKDPSTNANLAGLKARGVKTIGPDSGELASGLEGQGRMTEPEAIVRFLVRDLMQGSKLAGKRVLVTAGGTQEALDPVRYIGNRSSGKMGFAIAEEAAARGAQVELVTGPVVIATDRPAIIRTDVISAAEMAMACERFAPDCDIIVMAAAVADHTPKKPSDRKIKEKETSMLVELEPTVDILKGLGSRKAKHQRIVGFALETNDALANAQGKLERKNLDMIVLNSLSDPGAGFGHDTNKVTLLTPGTDPVQLPLMSKARTAAAILDHLEKLMPNA